MKLGVRKHTLSIQAKLITLACLHPSLPFTAPDEALTFLEPIQRKVRPCARTWELEGGKVCGVCLPFRTHTLPSAQVKSHENAVVSLNTARADLYLRMNKLDQTKELLEKCAEVLDTTSGVSPMHAHYYRVAAEHNKVWGGRGGGRRRRGGGGWGGAKGQLYGAAFS